MILSSNKYKDHNVVCFPKMETINSENAQDFKKALNEKLEQSNYQLILDGHNLEFIDSSGISALISCLKMTLQKSGYIHLVDLSDQINKVFSLVKLDKILSIYDSAEHAIEANKRIRL